MLSKIGRTFEEYARLIALKHPRRGEERRRPDWSSELEYVLKGRGEDIPVTVICDVFAVDKEKGKKFAFEINRNA